MYYDDYEATECHVWLEVGGETRRVTPSLLSVSLSDTDEYNFEEDESISY